MPNAVDIGQELLRIVRLPAGTTPLANPNGGATPDSGEVASGGTVAELSRELDSLRRQLAAADETARKQADILERNTRAVLEAGAARSLPGVGSAIASAASSVGGGGGLGLLASPLAALVRWLWGRGDRPEPEEPVRFALPAQIDANLGFGGANGPRLDPVAYRGDGLPRVVPASRLPAATNVSVQVQTMDSRSFLDNSDQIARAVREAMLNSHALNDVIGEM